MTTITHYDSIKKQKGKVTYYQSPSGEVVAKTCTGCGELKLSSEFNKNSNNLGDREPRCRVCVYEYRLKLSLATTSIKKRSNKKVQRPGTMKMKDYLRKMEEEKRKLSNG